MKPPNAPAREALAAQGRFASDTDYWSLPIAVRDRAQLILLDMIGVAVAGARTEELQALHRSWAPPVGPAGIFGTGSTAVADTAALLNGVAACSLEMDEGNKHTQGHPAVHVVFGALAEAASSSDPVDGGTLLSALIAGYEIAARWGRSLERRSELHPHGHWGATGAGAAVAYIRGLDAEGVTAAIDAAAGLIHVTPWDVVLAGSFVRNLWAAGSNVHGLLGARLAAAGVSKPDGTALRSLGQVGEIDIDELASGLGDRWDIVEGYFKRHSSCSYTHPAADAVIALRDIERFEADQIERMVVDTHRLSMPLARVATDSRLAAMFSFPYVMAVAATYGQVGPGEFTQERRADAHLRNLAERTEIRHDPALDQRLPTERAAVVTIELRDGRVLRGERPNPIGDAAYHPLDRTAVMTKLTNLIGREDTDRIAAVVDAIPQASDVAQVLADLP